MGKVKIILKAISFAARAHDGQIRKDEKTPYVSHAFRVSMILRHVFGVTDERVLAATVLHDTIEDTTTDFDDIDKEFGRDIAVWVGLLSKDKRKEEKEREEEYAAVLQGAPDAVKLIKLADVYDNIMDASTAKSSDYLNRALKRTAKYLQAIQSKKSEEISLALNCIKDLIKERRKNG